MPRPINYRSLREQYDADPRHCLRELGEAIESRDLKLDNWSVRELAEGFLGEDAVRRMDQRRKSGGFRLLEAASAVDTTAFSNVAGQFIYSKVKEQFNLADAKVEALCSTTTTTTPLGEKIPGVTPIGDEAEVVDEAQPYPTVGVGEEYVETPPLKKRGFIVPVTREIIVSDKTGQVVKTCGDTAKWLALNKLKRVLDMIFGVSNTYKRNGTAYNTYLTSGAYINTVTSNALVDWTDVENGWLAFDALTDPSTGEPIGGDLMGKNLTVIVPSALLWTARRVFNATEIRFGDGATGTTATYGKNPLSEGSGFTIWSSPYVKSRTGSASTWFMGDFKEAFTYMEMWGVETEQAPANSQADFERDIKLQYKVSEMGAPAVVEPRRVLKITA